MTERAVTAFELAGIRRSFGWSAYAGTALATIGNIALLLFYALELPNAVAGGSNPHVFGPSRQQHGDCWPLLDFWNLPQLLHCAFGHEADHSRAVTYRTAPVMSV